MLDNFIERNSHRVLILMFVVTLFSSFFHLYEYEDNFFYIFLSNLCGYSLCTNIFIWLWFNKSRKKFCWFSRNAPIGLIIINVFNILGVFTPYPRYEFFFHIVVCSICFSLYLVFKLMKNEKN